MKPSKLFRGLVRWHRWIGFAAGVLVLWLAISGALIQHAADFGLETEPVHSAWILDHYRIGEPPVISFRVGGHWFSQAGKSLYLDGRKTASLEESLVGAASFSGSVAAVSSARLLIFDLHGRLIEDLRPEHGLPGGIRAIGTRGDRLVLDTRDGTFEADPAEMRWRATHRSVPRPAPVEAPAALRAAIAQDARAREITRERLLRDLHSGVFFGTAGRWAIDLAALALLALATTGLWIWRRARCEFGAAKPANADRVRWKLSR